VAKAVVASVAGARPDRVASKWPAFIPVPWKVRDSIWVFLVSWVGIQVGLIIVIMLLAPHSAVAHYLLSSIDSGNTYTSFAIYLMSAVVGVFMIEHYLKRYHASWSSLGLRRFNPLHAIVLVLGIYVVFTLAVGLLFVVLSMLVPTFRANQPQNNDFTHPVSSLDRQLSILSLVIIPPLLEELVFRGLMFGAMASRWGVWTGALVSSLFFAFAHGQWNVGIYTFILGLVLCFMYRRLGSIWPGIALHALNNYIALSSLLHK
jgi:uncharacterized protein